MLLGNHVPFPCISFPTAYNEYVDSNILSNACQPGHVQPGLPGTGSTAVPSKLGLKNGARFSGEEQKLVQYTYHGRPPLLWLESLSTFCCRFHRRGLIPRLLRQRIISHGTVAKGFLGTLRIRELLLLGHQRDMLRGFANISSRLESGWNMQNWTTKKILKYGWFFHLCHVNGSNLYCSY